MDTKLTTEEIQLALYNSKIWNQRSDIMVPNVSFGLLEYEADFVVMTKSGYLTEVEIKRSWEDFKADFKKGHTHNDPKVYHFFYCLPESIKDKAIELLKEKCPTNLPAVLIYDENGKISREKCGWSERGGRKLFLEEQLTLARLGSLRYWNLRNKNQNTSPKLTNTDTINAILHQVKNLGYEIKSSQFSGYLIKFNEPDSNGVIFTKDSLNIKDFNNLKMSGYILDYEIDDNGVKIIKNFNLKSVSI